MLRPISGVCVSSLQAQLLASKVLKVHACGGRCYDYTIAAEVMSAEGAAVSFSLVDADADAAADRRRCALMDEQAWADVRHRAALTDELVSGIDGVEL